MQEEPDITKILGVGEHACTMRTCMQCESERRAISIAGTQTGRAPRSVRRAASFVAYWRGAVNSIRRFDSGRLSEPGDSIQSDRSTLT